MAKKEKNYEETVDVTENKKDNKKLSKDEEYDLVCELKKNYNDCLDYYADLWEMMKNDFDFYKGCQWDANEISKRKEQGRPREVFNQLGQFVDQVVNASKLNPPSINVKASDNLSSPKTVQVMGAAIKQYEYTSRASKAYLRAFENAVICGFGAFRLRLDYEDDDSFNQTIKIDPIANPFDAMIDPYFDDNYDNIKYGFITKVLSKDEFCELYPEIDERLTSWQEYQDNDWITENEVRIVEYFYTTYEKEEIYQVEGKATLSKEQYDLIEGNKPKILKKRKVVKKVINWVKSNGVDILEKTVFPGTRIPIIPVFGNNYISDGKLYFEGVIRQVKSAQKKYNYVSNSAIEMVANMSKGKIAMPEGAIENHRDDWDNIYTSNKPYVEFKPVSLDGTTGVSPIPLAQQYNVDVVGNLLQVATEEMKSITGIYDPSLGKEKTGEVSGVALLIKQRQSQVTNFKYIDSLSDSLEYAGAIMLDVIPYIVDEDTIIKVKDENSNKEIEVVLGQDLDVDLSKGKLGVEITVGPYGETQKQESAQAMLALMQAYPDAVSLIADQFVENQDWTGADVIAKRLKTLLPPELQEGDPNDELSNLSPQTRAMIAQQEQQYQAEIQMQADNIQQLTVELQNQQILISNLTAEANSLKQDSAKEMIKTQSQERISSEDNLVKIISELLKNGLPITSPQVSDLIQMLYGVRIDTVQNAAQPTLAPTIIIPGVNDPVTLASQQTPVENQIQQDQAQFQQQNNGADERDDILNSLNQQIEGGIPRTTTGNM